MVTPEEVTARLVAETQVLAKGAQIEAVRGAFARVLDRLDPPQHELAAWCDGVDVVGRAYERLLPGEHRRTAGQFFTPMWAAQLMAGWLLAEETQLMLDPGCGSGVLLLAAASHPRRGRAILLGLERDPLVLRMAEVNRALRGIDRCKLRQSDFLLDTLDEQPDAVICNPPYTRHHDIPAAEKAAIHEGIERRLGIRLSRLAGLHVLFLIRALEVSADGARLAFITPSDWLDVRYGSAIKRFLLERAHIEGIVLLKTTRLLFDGTLTTSAIWLLRKISDRRSPTRVVQVADELPPPSEVLAALAGDGDLVVDELLLSEQVKWCRPYAPREQGLRLGDIARVRRGIATGRNRFFVLSEERRRALGIPRSQLRPCIASPRLVGGEEVGVEELEALPDDVPRWVISCRDPQEEGRESPLGAYLRWGRDELGVANGYLARRRSPWYALEDRGDCPILFTYFNRGRPRFVRNRAGAIPLNTWLIVEPRPGVDPDELFAALSEPGVVRDLERRARVYGGGLWKLEPSELSRIRLPETRLTGLQLSLEVEQSR